MKANCKVPELSNPFVVYGYVAPCYFCDREEETEKILSALSNGRNVTLIAPRRMGKTGLIKNVFYLMRKRQEDVACFYMDIFATRDLPPFVRLLAETILGQLDTLSESVLHKLTGFFRSCRPEVSADELTGVPTVSLDFVPDKSQQILKEIFDYMAASGKKCCLAIDEFQQIASYPEKGAEALLRSYIQFLPNVHFIFSGSSQHLMSEMFTSAKRPFYQSTQLMALREITEESYYQFASAFLKQRGQALQKMFLTGHIDALMGIPGICRHCSTGFMNSVRPLRTSGRPRLYWCTCSKKILRSIKT